jgi:hypothetical protein
MRFEHRALEQANERWASHDQNESTQRHAHFRIKDKACLSGVLCKRGSATM